MTQLRLALRQLVKYPGFSAIVVLVLGLGIGASSTIFTLVNTLFLTPPPHVLEPERLVRVNRTFEGSAGSLSYPDFIFYQEHNTVLSGFAAYMRETQTVMTRGGDRNTQADLGLVSGNYFEVLGVPAALGRVFRSEEARVPRAGAVTVVSDIFWWRHLNGDPGVLGARLDINGTPFVIVGVAPAGFRGLSPGETAPDLWVPLTMQPAIMSSGGNLLARVPGENDFWLDGIGRIAPGIGFEAARDQITQLGDRLAREYSDWNANTGVMVSADYHFHPVVRQRLVQLFRLLSAAVGLVLLVACSNVAILLLARSSTRGKELGVRLALGASRPRLVAQLLLESTVLAVLGGGFGFLIANWSAEAAAGLIPGEYGVAFRPDWVVFVVTMIISLGTVFLFGLAPALLASRPDTVEELKGSTSSRGRSRLRSGLVIGQIALSLLLVSGATLFLRSLERVTAIDVGFETDNRLAVTVDLRAAGYSDTETRQFLREALPRIRSLPGVANAASTAQLPFRGMWSTTLPVPAGSRTDLESSFDAGANSVSPGYFDLMGIPIVSGRALEWSDDETATHVAVVNEAFARRVWGEEDPLGREIGSGARTFVVVGVARDATYYELGETPELQLYVSPLQLNRPRVSLLVETSTSALAAYPQIEREIRALDPNLVLSTVTTLDQILDAETGQYRVIATLVSLFGVLALGLAAIGLYGVLAYVVTRRTREFGVRLALGAPPSQVTLHVMGRGLRLAMVGVIAGAVASWLLATVVAGFLFGVEPHDPLTFTVVPLVLVGVAVLASFVPARRAARVDPVEALRFE
jgi:predicted permease